MRKIPTIQQLRQLRKTTKHLKLKFDPSHLQTTTGKLNIEALKPICQRLCEYADTVIFVSANGEQVTLKEPVKEPVS